MNRLFIILLTYLFINSYYTQAQDIYSVDKWMEYIEDMKHDEVNSYQLETLYNDLSYLAEHPFELNSVTEEQLKKLPFLSDLQIKELIEHIHKYGKMVTIYELKNVKLFNRQTIELLLPFVYIGNVNNNARPLTLANALKYGKNEMAFRYDQCMQLKKGYQQVHDSVLLNSPNKIYLGEPFYNSLRYSFAYDDKLSVGFVAEKDAGEPFFNRIHKGYDFYSAHVFIKNLGSIKSIALGDYKASFGQGLVMSHDFTPGRSSLVTNVERRNNGFRRHFSTNESDFFRGGAITIGLKKVDINLFYSYRKPDVVMDSNEIRSFKTDGLHRLVKDREKQGQVSMQTVGGNVRYLTPDFCVGITALSYSFGAKTVLPESQPYNIFYFRGKSNLNMSVDYLYRMNRLKLVGETALSANGAMATLNTLQLTPASYASFMLLYRSYSKKYQSFYGNAFSQNTSVQNEQGVYIGTELFPFAYWKLSMYADFFRFPWLKYGVNTPSAGKEYMTQVDYTPKKNFSSYIRYKYRDKEISNQHRFRLQANYSLCKNILFRTSLDGVIYAKDKANSKGWMFSQSAGWKPSTLPFQADVYMAYFHTDDYQSRISSFEKNILYAFSMPSFYGKGFRAALSFRIDITKHISVSGKVAHVQYTDREVIGFALEEISGRGKTDIYTLLRWKF